MSRIAAARECAISYQRAAARHARRARKFRTQGRWVRARDEQERAADSALHARFHAYFYAACTAPRASSRIYEVSP